MEKNIICTSKCNTKTLVIKGTQEEMLREIKRLKSKYNHIIQIGELSIEEYESLVATNKIKQPDLMIDATNK